MTQNPLCYGRFYTPKYSSSSQTGKRKTKRPPFFRYLRPKPSNPSKIFSLYVVQIFPLSYFYHWPTRYLFILSIRFLLYSFISSGNSSFRFFLFSFSILRFCLFFSFYFQFSSCSQICSQVSSDTSSSSTFSSTCGSVSGYYVSLSSFFFETVLLIALIPYGGSVMIASKNYPYLKVSLVLSILMMLGMLSSYCSKLRFILGVNSQNFFSSLQKGDFLLILPTEYPLMTLISRSDPKVIAPLVAGGISKPPVPTKGSMTQLQAEIKAWLHIKKARSLSVDVGPRQILLFSSYLLLNLAVAILLLQSRIPKQTRFKVVSQLSL